MRELLLLLQRKVLLASHQRLTVQEHARREDVARVSGTTSQQLTGEGGAIKVAAYAYDITLFCDEGSYGCASGCVVCIIWVCMNAMQDDDKRRESELPIENQSGNCWPYRSSNKPHSPARKSSSVFTNALRRPSSYLCSLYCWRSLNRLWTVSPE